MMDFGLREVREVVDKLQCKGKLFIESNKGFRYAPTFDNDFRGTIWNLRWVNVHASTEQEPALSFTER